MIIIYLFSYSVVVYQTLSGRKRTCICKTVLQFCRCRRRRLGDACHGCMWVYLYVGIKYLDCSSRFFRFFQKKIFTFQCPCNMYTMRDGDGDDEDDDDDGEIFRPCPADQNPAGPLASGRSS